MNALWRRLIAGQVTTRQLPAALDLSDIQAGMACLWQSTAQDRQERGACIGLDAHDRLTLVHAVTGWAQGVQPMHQPSDCDGEYVGFFHTHPLYPGGAEQVGFSEADFAAALESGDWLSVARSGDRLFALVRTEKTRKRRPVSQRDINKFLAIFQCYLDDDTLTESEAQRQATLKLCRQLGFAFYAGEFGQPLRS